MDKDSTTTVNTIVYITLGTVEETKATRDHKGCNDVVTSTSSWDKHNYSTLGMDANKFPLTDKVTSPRQFESTRLT